MDYGKLAAELHEAAVKKGFWDVDDALVKHCAKMLSELGEVVQEDRAGIMYEVERDGAKPEGVAAELADFVMMVLDYGASEGVDLKASVEAYPYSKFVDIMRDDTVLMPTYALVMVLQIAFGKMFAFENERKHNNALVGICHVTRLWLAHRGYDLEALIREKMAYNASRPKLHGRLY